MWFCKHRGVFNNTHSSASVSIQRTMYEKKDLQSILSDFSKKDFLVKL